MDAQSSFPFFMPTDSRPLSTQERVIVERLIRELSPRFSGQVDALNVVGRCGCGICPTVFFQAYEAGDTETDIATMAGRDSSGGLVAVVLLEKAGALSQLEFYSVDGHDPWGLPIAETLGPL